MDMSINATRIIAIPHIRSNGAGTPWNITPMMNGITVPDCKMPHTIIATAYTFIGGMRAVMWTDVAQFFVLFGGISSTTAAMKNTDISSSSIQTVRKGGQAF